MQLRPTLPLTPHQADLLEHREVLRDRLPRRRDVVRHRQSTANLKETLPIASAQFVEDEAPSPIGEGTVKIVHCPLRSLES